MFIINRIGKGSTWEIVRLSDQEIGLSVDVVPAAGAIMNAIRFTSGGGENLVDGYSGREDFTTRVHQGFWSAKLSPFVCRLHHARYSWKGSTYKLDKFLLNGSALHGILYDAPFEIVSETQDPSGCSVVVRYQYDGYHSGYPFPFNCTITYLLERTGVICINTQISNPQSASSDIPLADGWHPYFRLGGKADDWWLQIASDKMLEYNIDLIPTGEYVQNKRFSEGRLIGDIKLDNGYMLKEDLSPICVLKNPANGLSVTFASQKNYPFLQVYIPDHRESIAIENLSSAPDAFNNGMGLITLSPGEKMDFQVRIKVATR